MRVFMDINELKRRHFKSKKGRFLTQRNEVDNIQKSFNHHHNSDKQRDSGLIDEDIASGFEG